MKTVELFDLYVKERKFQKSCFGEYEDIESLNLASFFIFIEQYLKESKEAYSGKWTKEFPKWFITSKEKEIEGTAPVRAYEQLIKVFVLSGAALEAFCDLLPDKWRENLEKDISKWK